MKCFHEGYHRFQGQPGMDMYYTEIIARYEWQDILCAQPFWVSVSIHFGSLETKNVGPRRYRTVKDAWDTSFTKVPKKGYHDHDWEYSDKGSGNTHEKGFDGNDGVKLGKDGVKRATGEAAKLLLHIRRVSSKCLVYKALNIKINFQWLLRTIGQHWENVICVELLLKNSTEVDSWYQALKMKQFVTHLIADRTASKRFYMKDNR